MPAGFQIGSDTPQASSTDRDTLTALFPLTPTLSLGERIPRFITAPRAPEPGRDAFHRVPYIQGEVRDAVKRVPTRFRGREPRSLALAYPERSKWASTRPRVLPLPEGEGWGEGEEHARCLRTYECDSWMLSTQFQFPVALDRNVRAPWKTYPHEP
jgi:hypothetical protein